MNHQASIFNDVIGPVMRGPSSSHTAASWRAAKIAIQLLGAPLEKAKVEFDKDGQWATNYEAQGTTLGMNGGLLDIDMVDDQMKIAEKIAKQRGVEISYHISSFPNQHPNSMKIGLIGRDQELEILAASLGGGSFEIQKIDAYDVNIKGDRHGICIWANKDVTDDLIDILGSDIAMNHQGSIIEHFYELKFSRPIDMTLIDRLKSTIGVTKCEHFNPIMPIVLGNEKGLPFSDIASLITYSQEQEKSLGELGLQYEQCLSGLSEEELKSKMSRLISIIENSIKIGLRGTTFDDRILPQQSNLVGKAEKAGKILQGSIINTIVKNVAAIMESKSALELVVANPTAGSCGSVGAAIAAVTEELKSNEDEKVMAYFAAGLVGAYFAMGPGFSAEEHGCQVECGASAGMAAAAIVDLFEGSAEQALGAASMAIQNMIGLVCDPIADRVEAPCLGKNTSAAVNALSSATMAASGFAHLIPLDQVLETVQRVSDQMPSCNKCTGTGGLAITPAALKIKEELAQRSKIN